MAGDIGDSEGLLVVELCAAGQVEQPAGAGGVHARGVRDAGRSAGDCGRVDRGDGGGGGGERGDDGGGGGGVGVHDAGLPRLSGGCHGGGGYGYVSA